MNLTRNECMILNNCNVTTWLENHIGDPQEKKDVRELLPFSVFAQVVYSITQIGMVQEVNLNGILYKVELNGIEAQKGNRFKAILTINTTFLDGKREWKNIQWSKRFSVVYSESGYFITAFEKTRKGNLTDLIKRFLKGNFERIEKEKSLPLSDLLFRSLINDLGSQHLPQYTYRKEFEYKDAPVKYLDSLPENLKIKRSNFYPPIFSEGRSHWVCYAFDQDLAHRIGYYMGYHCENLTVVYCNPSLDRYQRCVLRNVKIKSLFEFAYELTPATTQTHFDQIRFLQNHLNRTEKGRMEDLEASLTGTDVPEIPIDIADLKEALSLINLMPTNDQDLFYYLSAMNLLNAYLTRGKKDPNLQINYRYYFKGALSKVVAKLLKEYTTKAKVYLDTKKQILMVELFDFQFSFHNYDRKIEVLKQYENSEKNKPIKWNGMRLQRIAPAIFQLAKRNFKHVNV